MKHTLVIVGAGLAGLSAALTAVKNGWTVKLVSSLASERAQSVMAEGGINAALNTKGEEDSPEQHYADTLTAACGLADPNAVWGMTQAAPELVHSLHRLGVQFNVTDDDELDLRNFGGQKKKRTAFAQSDTGKQLMTALIDAVRREESAGTVERFPHHKFRTLLFSGNICGGCTVQDTYTGELLRFVCDAVLIATGGPHGLFGDTTGSLANTGEVTAELFRLGVPMANLEMIQYHPTTVEQGGKRMLLSEAARGEGGRLLALRNGKPWYFMEEKYPELGNLMPRDITAREVWTVSRDYEVFLDMTELPKEVMEHKLAGLVDDCQTYLHKDIKVFDLKAQNRRDTVSSRQKIVGEHPGLIFVELAGFYIRLFEKFLQFGIRVGFLDTLIRFGEFDFEALEILFFHQIIAETAYSPHIGLNGDVVTAPVLKIEDKAL